jgi:1-acyl-sn-glycerol-3-phosphate acyltransferase
LRRVRRLVYFTAWIVGRLLLAPFVRFHTVHRARLPRRGALILACNHIAYFDPPFLVAVTPRMIDWMAMAELFRHRLGGGLLRTMGSFPVDRAKADRQAVKTALERLRMGRVVGIFPEGGIREGVDSVLREGKIRPGVGALAQLSGEPTVPCVILESDRLAEVRNWRPWKPVKVWVIYGEPMRCESREKRARVEFEAGLERRLKALGVELRARAGLVAG